MEGCGLVGGVEGEPVGGLDGGLVSSVGGVLADACTNRRGCSHLLGIAVPGHITFTFFYFPVTPVILCLAKQIIVHSPSNNYQCNQ